MYPRAEEIENSDQLRNITCHEYLSYIRSSIANYYLQQGVPTIENPLPLELSELLKFLPLLNSHYVNTLLYGNDYTNFMNMLDLNILAWRAKYKSLPYLYHLTNTIVDAVYNNPNEGLQRATDMVKPILTSPSEEKESIDTRIDNRMAKSIYKKYEQFRLWQSINITTPHTIGKGFHRFRVSRFGELKVQHETNIPNIRHYKYKTALDPVEFRIGTQAQFQGNLLYARIPCVSPMFISLLEQQKEIRDAQIAKDKEKNINPITHVYFNFLKSTKSPTQWHERGVEGYLTDALNTLDEYEKNDKDDPSKYHYDNVAVITLPADNDLISYDALKTPGELSNTDAVLTDIKEITSGQSKNDTIDFYISDRIRKLLFEDKEAEEKSIDGMLQKSLQKLGLTEKTITSAQKQALYFHFFKFELPDYILATLKPVSFNMSCKDTIDRGGASSAYYNLLNSIERQKPLDEDEFNYALYGASLLVKARLMNDHLKVIWNAVNIYLKNPANHSAPEWLKKWRKNNKPHYPLHNLEIIKNLNGFIGQEANEEELSKLAAKKLKNLIDDSQLTAHFSLAEWNALQQGCLNDYFTDLLPFLTDKQREKIAVLNDLYQEMIKMKPDDALGQELWQLANSTEYILQQTERDKVNAIPELASLLLRIETLQQNSPQSTMQNAGLLVTSSISRRLNFSYFSS